MHAMQARGDKLELDVIDDDWDEDSFAPIVVFDLGAREWRCGWAGDDGPAVVVAPPGVASREAVKSAIMSAFDELEAEADEHAILISERPGTQVSEREAMAKLLFDLGVQAFYASACPFLTLYHTGMDTGVVLDVGERSTHVYLIYEGYSVLDAATVVAVGGSVLPDGESGPASACSDGLFEPPPSAAPKPTPSQPPPRSSVGVHEAVVRTVALADMSMRGTLLRNVMLGASSGSSSHGNAIAPLATLQRLRQSLSPARAAPAC